MTKLSRGQENHHRQNLQGFEQMDQMTVADHKEANIQKKDRENGENREYKLKPAVVQ